MSVPTKTLPGGTELPVIGFGTWDISGDPLRESLRAALDAGYTHVDTAEGYENEELIGEVLADYDRDGLFLTSKVLPKHLGYESVLTSCEASLERLGTDYLDLYLIHWPNPAISLRETLNAMAKLHDDGLVRNVGVSNFSGYQLGVAHHVSDVPIAVNQIEFHPWLQRPELVEFCEETGTVIEAAAPLARTEIFEDGTIGKIANRRGKSPAQVALRWSIDRGIVPLPKSSNPDHVRQNFEVFDWELTEQERQEINGVDRREPVYDSADRDWNDDVYGISP